MGIRWRFLGPPLHIDERCLGYFDMSSHGLHMCVVVLSPFGDKDGQASLIPAPARGEAHLR